MERQRTWNVSGGDKWSQLSNLFPDSVVQLYSHDDKTNPIAKFAKSTSQDTPGSLTIDSRGIAMRDVVVVSFLLLEKSRRARENSTMSHASASGTPPFTFSGQPV